MLMPPLTQNAVLQSLANQIEQALARQQLERDHPDYGALINPDWGIADPGHGGTTPVVAGCVLLGLAGRSEFVPRATLAADYLLRAQRPSGLIDLRNCNYDSSPDTGFAVQLLCAALALGRPRAGQDADFDALLAQIEQFVRRAVPGMLTGGFHTPNHRWVIASALAQAGALFPDLPVGPTIAAYLAEGFDLDAEGMYLERSAGVYDAVCDRSLLLLADCWDAPGAREAARANLHLNLHLFHADGTAETGLSHRQDYGQRVVPASLVASYLHSAARDPNPVFVHAAQWLWERATPGLGDTVWVAATLLRDGEPAPSSAALPDDFTHDYPHNGLWRVRRGALSVSGFRDSVRLLALHYGQAELSSVSIAQSYFGCGQFVADTLTVADGVATLHSAGQRRPRRPGYDQPLGRPVPPEAWAERLAERDNRPVPPATSTLTLREAAGGLTLRYQTLAGLDSVTTQIAFDFPPGGAWETDDTAVLPQAGQVLFLKQGYGVMRYGSDAIRIGPGTDAHRMWQMRDADPPRDRARVVFAFTTPVDHTFTITGFRGLSG
jgi:hypothetical protein